MSENAKPTYFGKFELLQLLEEGTAARLYKATNTKTGRTVLLRVVTASVSANPRLAAVFEELSGPEYRGISHPNVLALLDAGKLGRRYYFAFEYLEGQPLSALLSRSRLEQREALDILRQVTEALRLVHQLKRIHGDIKPGNIIVGRDRKNRPVVKLTLADFSTVASEGMVSVYGELVGTPKYMSPEQIAGRAMTGRSDIFSLGIVAYRMFAGREAFQVENPLGYLRANAERVAVPLAQIDTGIPTEISLMVAKMMERDATKRYRGCQSLLEDLERVEARIAGDYSEVAPPGVDSAFARKLPVLESPSKSSSWRMAALLLGAAFIFTLGYLLAAAMRTPAPQERTDETATKPPLQVETVVQPHKTPEPAVLPLPSPLPVSDSSSELKQAKARAQDYINRGRFDDAFHEFEALAAKHEGTPTQLKARDGMAWVLYEHCLGAKLNEEYDAALDICDELAQSFPDSEWTKLAANSVPFLLYEQADLKLSNNDIKGALGSFKILLDEHKDTAWERKAERQVPKLMFEVAEKERTGGDPALAVRMYKQIISAYPDTESAEQAAYRLPEALLLQGEGLLTAGTYDVAFDTFKQLSENHPDTSSGDIAKDRAAQALYEWSKLLMTRGKIREALEKWQTLSQQHPDSRWLDEAAESTATVRGIAERLSAAGETNGQGPSGPAILLAWAEELSEQGKNEEAEKALRQLVKEYPDSEEAGGTVEKLAAEAYALAEQNLLAGRVDAAAKLFETIITRYPGGAAAENAAALLEFVQGAPDGMVPIPVGDFIMGTRDEDTAALCQAHGIPEILASRYFFDEQPAGRVNQPAFYVDKYEVTNAEYKRFVDDAGHAPPLSSAWEGAEVMAEFRNFPVTNVNWTDASDYAEWAGKRLPTEAEWEKAARGTDGRLYSWGSEFSRDKASLASAGTIGASAVGSNPEDCSPYGCLDMIGNVREWTNDSYLPYKNSETQGAPFDPHKRVLRGGSYAVTNEPYLSTCANRFADLPVKSAPDVGFRCAKSP